MSQLRTQNGGQSCIDKGLAMHLPHYSSLVAGGSDVTSSHCRGPVYAHIFSVIPVRHSFFYLHTDMRIREQIRMGLEVLHLGEEDYS